MDHEEENFYLGPTDMEANFVGFQEWAFSNIHVPIIRGQLIEFFLIRHLRRHQFDVANQVIRQWTEHKPEREDLDESTAPFYTTQPHMDIFDLQMHWGLTYEIKSTSSDSRANWSLTRTCRWNPITRSIGTEKIFPAQYYVLADLNYENFAPTRKLQFPEAKFYVKTGRQLDQDTAKSKKSALELDFKPYFDSIGYNRFIKDVKPIALDGLMGNLRELAAAEMKLQISKLDGPWRIKPPRKKSAGDNFIPLAFTDGKCAWFKESNGNLSLAGTIVPPPWKADIDVTWRDWESVGFRYVDLASDKLLKD